MLKVPMKRRACDRCYARKLGCQREGDSCTRCIKSNVRCVWGDSKRQRKITPDAISGSTSSLGVWSETTAGFQGDNWADNGNTSNLPAWHESVADLRSDDWVDNNAVDLPAVISSFGDVQIFPFPGSHDIRPSGPAIDNTSLNPGDFNHTTISESDPEFATIFNIRDSSSNLNPFGLAPEDTTDCSSRVAAGDPLTSILKQLFQLNAELYSHATDIKQRASPRSQQNGDHHDPAKRAPIDRTFRLSQQMIDVLNHIHPIYREVPAAQLSKNGVLILDQGSALLIFSCYVRLLEIYGEIFRQIRLCAEKSALIPESEYLNTPDVNIGDFTAPLSSVMQITVVIQVASQFLERLTEFIKQIGAQSEDSRSEYGGQSDSLDMEASGNVKTSTLEAIKQQERLVAREKLLLQQVLAKSKVL